MAEEEGEEGGFGKRRGEKDEYSRCWWMRLLLFVVF